MKRFLPFLLLLTACSTAQLDVPSGSYEVTGANPRRWNQPISFGNWRTEVVNEGTRRSWLADAYILKVAKADQAYHLTLNGIPVECHTRELVLGQAGVFVDPAFGANPILVCGYAEKAVLTLMRTGQPDPSLRGTIRASVGAPLEVRSLHRAAGAAFPSGEPFGYEILSKGERIVMVETINQGRVWIDPAAPDRDTLAAIAASLLLFRDPDAGNVD